MRANNKSPFGQFYILYKIHKEKRTTAGLLVLSALMSPAFLMHLSGKWVNEMLAPVQQAQDSNFQDSFALKAMLNEMKLPPNALLFTSDATSMYTNIKTKSAIENLRISLRELSPVPTLPHRSPHRSSAPGLQKQPLQTW